MGNRASPKRRRFASVCSSRAEQSPSISFVSHSILSPSSLSQETASAGLNENVSQFPFQFDPQLLKLGFPNSIFSFFPRSDSSNCVC
ncbi:unnamed protein product [Citrullus colocynthis]|uniref:Uncharacterized protein n=1 Tax=Citrullus colocynthis TaxID=252529 RepID=A0ABP0Z142_9ROSI